ncbi:hypothetical protein PFUGPA_04313 [Plasmodium falciparum Palo Alto/Uganda]|uniref:Uncharacterized protein n=2 Tax=Plasmodium falciparum TaxID=5833 RepID=W4IYL9_PLAFP|nr:hypothetical protein PFUGPA_04313 [Plasmodium falciparum Palo Alto/Uganda]ETW58765.1 hypothetical protein PFMC_05858 [Plasmodium falciparum CAMP/Malaysia]
MKCAYKCNVENNQNMNNTFKSSLNKCFKMIRTECIIGKRKILYYMSVNVLFFLCFIFIFSRFNSGQFYEKWKNKPNIKSICGRRLHRSLYEYQICNNSKYFKVYGNNQNIQIDNYNNAIIYLDDYSQNDVLNNSKSIILNNEIINTKCNVLLRKQRVLYEEKKDVSKEGNSETLGDLRSKLKTKTEKTNRNIYANVYENNLNTKENELNLPNNAENENQSNIPTNTNDARQRNRTESDVKPKVINFAHGGFNNKRIVEYEVVPKIVTTTEEGKVRINRVEYELRAKYEKSKNYEVNNNDRETNDISSKMETQNEPTIKNSNDTNDVKKEDTNITQQGRVNSNSSNINGVKSNVTTKETQSEKPCNNNQTKQATNRFIKDDESDKKDKIQDNNKGLNVTTNKTNLKNKLGNNTKQINQGTKPFVGDDISDQKDKFQDSNKGLKKGTNPFIDEDELEELLRLEREEKNKK